MRREFPSRGSGKGQGGQAYTEYVIILAVWFALGMGVAFVFIGFDALRSMIFDLYAGMANFMNLPFL